VDFLKDGAKEGARDVTEKKDFSIVLCGEAGQGIQTVEQILTRILKKSGYHIFGTKEYMSRVRGGTNSTLIRVSSAPVAAPVDRIDLLLPLDDKALSHLDGRISAGTMVIGDPDVIKPRAGKGIFHPVPLVAMAEAAGGALYGNTTAAGVVAGLFDITREELDAFIGEFFGGMSGPVIENNRVAAEKGFDAGKELARSGKVTVPVKKDRRAAGDILLNGADAVGIGALAGGCDFLSAYPMSPSTAVMVFLAQHAREFGIVVEQAEDEIAAINMALGAWYAGARALVSTSGGGFALMEEGLSLAGMHESPLVVHLAQRPGPATGLPTRTGQEDLNLVLYAGHGEFPRCVYAPGSLEEAVSLTALAFNTADRHQVPVFVLTDQYFMDSYYNTAELPLDGLEAVRSVVETEPSYRRYAFMEDGVSPRGIPGFGRGLVVAGSDEHDEEGHITENLGLRARMVDKRLSKEKRLREEALPPVLHGDESCETLLIGWGSTDKIIQEALELIGRQKLSYLHFPQVYPLSPDAAVYLKKAKTVISIEGNATGQFAALAEKETGIPVTGKILRYDGLPFTVEELVERIGKIFKGEG